MTDLSGLSALVYLAIALRCHRALCFLPCFALVTSHLVMTAFYFRLLCLASTLLTSSLDVFLALIL